MKGSRQACGPNSHSRRGMKLALFLGNELDLVACTGDWLSRKIGYDSTRANPAMIIRAQASLPYFTGSALI